MIFFTFSSVNFRSELQRHWKCVIMALSLTVDIYPDKGLLMFTLAISCSKQNGKGKLLHRHVSFLAFGTAQQKHTEFFEFGTQPVSPSALHCCRRSQHSPVAVSHEKKRPGKVDRFKGHKSIRQHE